MAFSWQAVANAPAGIDGVSAVRLNDGRIFVLSGFDPLAYFYDPIAQTWALAGGGPPAVSRNRPGMCILGDGKVFVFGGRNLPAGALRGDIYDPIGETWTQTTGTTASGYLNGCRVFYFPSTNKVGIFYSNNALKREITLYDVAGQTFSSANFLGGEHAGSFETAQLANGNIFICGGAGEGDGYDGAVIYDYVSNTFLPVTGTMQQPRQGAVAVLLDSGNVLVTGGIDEETDDAKLVDMFLVGSTSLAPVAPGPQRFALFRSPFNIQYGAAFSGSRAIIATHPDIFFGTPGTVAQVYKEISNTWVSVPLPSQIAPGPIIRLTTGIGHVLAIADDGNSEAEIFIGDDEEVSLTLSLVKTAPYSGPIAGGTPVVVYGTGFESDAVVTFGDQLATEVIVHNDTRLTCVTPAHAKGLVSVAVTNIAIPASTTLLNGFFYAGPEQVYTNTFDFSGGD